MIGASPETNLGSAHGHQGKNGWLEGRMGECRIWKWKRVAREGKRQHAIPMSHLFSPLSYALHDSENKQKKN
jgi:hypothetical protein